MTSDYYPFAVVFEKNAKCLLVKGSGKADNHAALLKRNNLLTRFEVQPRDFVMGRIRHYEERKTVLLDTASDIFYGKTGCEKPLDNLPEEKRRQFEKTVRAILPHGWRVFLLDAGMALRVPGVSAPKLTKLLGSRTNDKGEIILEITWPEPPPGVAL